MITWTEFCRGLVCDIFGHRWLVIARGKYSVDVWCSRCGDLQAVRRRQTNVIEMEDYRKRSNRR